MTKLSLSPRYPGLAHRGPLRRASRYDPFGTLSLITGFVSSLKPPKGGFFMCHVGQYLPECAIALKHATGLPAAF
ncbi:hypothetical protein E4343_02575 [Serratia quinivorans]|nr:hypothetical protein E4343_02575 [Serratia quinivorans]